MTDDTERWLAAPGYDGLYEVSTHGRVRSLRKGKVMSPGSGKDGYPIISLYGPTGRKGITVHRLVALTFVPGQNTLHKEVAHLDGVRTNARADNLMWTDKIQNHSHRKAHGTWPSGENSPRAILTWAKVDEIRLKRKSTTAAILASKFGVSRETIYDVWREKSWKPTPQPPSGDHQ